MRLSHPFQTEKRRIAPPFSSLVIFLWLFAVIFLRPSRVRVCATATAITAVIRRSTTTAIARRNVRRARTAVARTARIITRVIARIITRVIARVATAIARIAITTLRHDKVTTAIPTNALGITEKNIPNAVLVTTAATAARGATAPITSITHSTSILLVYLRKLS